MNRTHCVALLGMGLGLALAPAAVTAQEAGEGGMRPVEVKAAQLASRWVLGAQQQERAIAKTVMPEGLDQEVARLRRAVRELQDAERAASLEAVLPGASPSSALAEERPARRRQAQEDADRIASRRAAITSRLTDIKSSRQRRVGQAVVGKLEAIERELREAVEAPPEERMRRLGALQRRLIDRHGVDGEQRAADHTPTFQILRRSELPELEILEERP